MQHARAEPQSSGAVPTGFRARLRPSARRLCSHAGVAGARRGGICAGLPARLPVRVSCCIPGWARISFPASDTGQFKLHLRAKTGTRIEETARLCDLVEQSIRRQIPASNWSAFSTRSACPTAASTPSTATPRPSVRPDADILVSLTEEHRPTEEYRAHAARHSAAANFPARTSTSCPTISSARF